MKWSGGPFSPLNRDLPRSDDPSWTSPLRFTGEVEILPANATDPITSIDDPTLVSEFQDDVFLDLELPVDASFRAGSFTVLRRVDFPVAQFIREERSVVLRGTDNPEWFQFQVDSNDALPVDVAFEVEVLLRDVVELAIEDLLEAFDALLERHVGALEAGELLGDEERLRQEALDFSGAVDDLAVVFA